MITKNKNIYQRLAKLSLLFFLTLLFACNSKESQQKELYNEVLGIHNEVMPKMEEISGLTVKLKEKLKAMDKDSANSEKAASIKQTIQDLEGASRGMMDWMRGFNAQYDTLPHPISIQYLNEEKLKIQKVKSDINTAINSAKEKI